MNNLTVLGKYLDQPMLVGKFSKSVPAVLATGGGTYLTKDVYEAPKEDKKKTFIRNGLTMAATVISAAFAPRLAYKTMNLLSKSHTEVNEPHAIKKAGDAFKAHLNEAHCSCGHHHHHNHDHGAPFDYEHTKHELTELVEHFKNENPELSKTISPLLEKSKTTFLKFNEIKQLFNSLNQDSKGQAFLKKLVPDPENIDSGHLFGEIGRISTLGLIPVIGGIAGGIAGDKVTDKNWKDKIPNKIKEGTYQYLANIFMCNIGAGAALLALEKANCHSKKARAFGMITGIILAGVVFGSTIANVFGKFCIDPLVNNKNDNLHTSDKNKGLFSERTPEALDLGLHLDDVATVAVLSGLKWIEPALPVMYAISGYRAGIGYRNGDNKNTNMK